MMMRHAWLLLVLAAALPGWVSCATPPAAAQSAKAETRWHALGSWSGRGNRQTESFDVTTGALRLTWQAHGGGASAGRLRVSLHSAISGRPLQTVVDQSGAGAGTAFVEDDPRVSYLVIESENVEWRLSLDEVVP